MPGPSVVDAPVPPAESASLDKAVVRLLKQPVRLSMLRALLDHESLSFSEIKRLMPSVTDGNLCVHARRLENRGVVTCTKGWSGRFPRTEYRLTPAGRSALERFLSRRR